MTIGVSSPSVARNWFTITGEEEGPAGVVFAIPASADGRVYTLTKTGGWTGRENLNVHFYASLEGVGVSCASGAGQPAYEPESSESGPICAEADLTVAWAIVYLNAAGAGAGFELSW